MDYYLGEIRTFAGNYAPEGWNLCDGSLLSVNEYQGLFTLLGTTYGGDGVTNFAVPNLMGNVVVGTGTAPGTGTTYTLNQKGGALTATLTESTMPVHNHNLFGSTDDATTADPTGNYLAATTGAGYPDVKLYTTTTADITAPNATLDPQTVKNQGGGQPHSNLMPYTNISFIIALTGVFPTPNQ